MHYVFHSFTHSFFWVGYFWQTIPRTRFMSPFFFIGVSAMEEEEGAPFRHYWLEGMPHWRRIWRMPDAKRPSRHLLPLPPLHRPIILEEVVVGKRRGHPCACIGRKGIQTLLRRHIFLDADQERSQQWMRKCLRSVLLRPLLLTIAPPIVEDRPNPTLRKVSYVPHP